MSLIDSSYFIGERNIPNTSYPDVASLVDNLISRYERVYLESALGYELFKLFNDGLTAVTVDQRWIDLLFGKEFTGLDGRLKLWPGFVSVTTALSTVVVNQTLPVSTFFTVGQPGAPINGDSAYINTGLAGKVVKFVQRVNGPLEPLKQDNSNSATADISINPLGGFTWLNSITFSTGDKFEVQILGNTFTIINPNVVSNPVSVLADYIYYYYLRLKVNSASGTGQVHSENENAVSVTSRHQQAKAWNDMVEKSCVLYEFLQSEYTVYPEFQNNSGRYALVNLLTKINPYGI